MMNRSKKEIFENVGIKILAVIITGLVLIIPMILVVLIGERIPLVSTLTRDEATLITTLVMVLVCFIVIRKL